MLGELIEKLTQMDKTKIINQNKLVWFDFCDLVPTTLDSYRGYYEDLAIGWSRDGEITVTDLLARLRECVGKMFHSYKGGTYVMDLETPLWVANCGSSHSTMVVGVHDLGYSIIIETACESIHDE